MCVSPLGIARLDLDCGLMAPSKVQRPKGVEVSSRHDEDRHAAREDRVDLRLAPGVLASRLEAKELCARGARRRLNPDLWFFHLLRGRCCVRPEFEAFCGRAEYRAALELQHACGVWVFGRADVARLGMVECAHLGRLCRAHRLQPTAGGLCKQSESADALYGVHHRKAKRDERRGRLSAGAMRRASRQGEE